MEVDALATDLGYPPDIVAGYLRVHAMTDAPLSDAAQLCPVVLFAGDVSHTALYYTSLLEDIASHGYIVVALSYPYSNSFTVLSVGQIAFATSGANADTAEGTTGRDQIGGVWVADALFVLNQLGQLNTSDVRFTGRLDLNHMAFIGHGLGGAVMLNVIASDNRFGGGISLDGRVLGSSVGAGLNRPVMFVDPAANALHLAAEKTLLDQIKANSISTVYNIQAINGVGTTFGTDLDVLSGVFATTTNSDNSIGIVRSYTEAFLDKYLKGLAVPLLDSATNALAGVQFEITEPPTK